MATFKTTVRGERKDGFMQVYIRVSHRARSASGEPDEGMRLNERLGEGVKEDSMIEKLKTS